MIPQKILNLVNLALRDGVLTYRERETIVAEASKFGVSKPEIDAFLDNSLKSAISKMDKESLKHCPKCGGQIPLVADNCPYCGHSFVDSEASEDSCISGSEAARIINQENISTQESAKNLKTCPDCGAPFPVLGNVCTHCGHILHEGQYSVFNIRNLTSSIHDSIDGMGKCKVSVWDMIWHRRYIYAAELSFLCFVIETCYESFIVTFLSFAFFIYAVVSYLKCYKITDSPVELADREYYIQLAQSEKFNRHIDALYGINPEARTVLDQFNEAMADAEKTRRKNRGLVILINALLIVTLFSLIFVAGNNNSLLEGNITQQSDIYSLMERKVPVVFGLSDKKGKLSKDPLKIKYFDVSDTAILTVSHRPGSTGGLIYESDSIFVLRLNNVHIKSSGIRYNLPTDTLCLNASFFDREGNFIKPPSVLFDEEFRIKSHAFHKLPDGSKLDFRTIMENGKYEYYANFQSGEIGISQIDSVKSFLDRAYSFVLLLK